MGSAVAPYVPTQATRQARQRHEAALALQFQRQTQPNGGFQQDEIGEAARARLQAVPPLNHELFQVVSLGLERAIFDLTTKGDKNPGRLKLAEAAVAQTAASVEKGEAALEQLERDRDALSASRERRGEAERALSEKRAKAVSDYFAAQGIPLDRLSPSGMGIGEGTSLMADPGANGRIEIVVPAPAAPATTTTPATPWSPCACART